MFKLHWLHVPERIDYKVAVLTYKVLHGSAPVRRSISDHSFLLPISLADGHYALVAPCNRLVVPSVRRSTVGDWAFTVAGPRVWNTLPEEITTSQTLFTFRQQLKTWLFRKSYPDIIIWTFLIQTINLEVALLHRQSLIDWLIDWLLNWTLVNGRMHKVLGEERNLKLLWWCTLLYKYS